MKQKTVKSYWLWIPNMYKRSFILPKRKKNETINSTWKIFIRRRSKKRESYRSHVLCWLSFFYIFGTFFLLFHLPAKDCFEVENCIFLHFGFAAFCVNLEVNFFITIVWYVCTVPQIIHENINRYLFFQILRKAFFYQCYSLILAFKYSYVTASFYFLSYNSHY